MVKLGCGLDGLEDLPARSVGLVLSDLPSGETRAGFDKVPDLPRLFRAGWRVSETLVFMASSLPFAARLIATSPEEFRYDLVWEKSLATGFLNASDRPLRAHEFVLVFSKGKPPYRPQMLEGASPIHAARRKSGGENYGAVGGTESRAGETTRYPVSVLQTASLGTSSKERVHPQQKPVALMRWLVETYSYPGALVVDPCAGSGSVGAACAECGRDFLGWDTDPRFGR